MLVKIDVTTEAEWREVRSKLVDLGIRAGSGYIALGQWVCNHLHFIVDLPEGTATDRYLFGARATATITGDEFLTHGFGEVVAPIETLRAIVNQPKFVTHVRFRGQNIPVRERVQ